MSRTSSAGRSASVRRTFVVSLASLLVVTAAFAWLAAVSFKWLHSGKDIGVSKLAPVRLTGPEQTVFNWSKQACESRDIPDAPARAFRDASGTVHLIASSYVTRQMTGPGLNRLKHRCPVVMRSAFDSNPSKYNDKEWIAAPYTTDGRTVFALVHNEYQGDEHPGRCLSGVYLRCWFNSITLARSDDGGTTFADARPAPRHLVASLPYGYLNDRGPIGIFQPSNIVSKDGYYYTMVYATRYRYQEQGACVMRTKRLGDPTSWRAWGGNGFDVRFANPYVARVSAADHVCRPVDPDQIATMTTSLTYSTYFKKFLLVGASGDRIGSKGRIVNGFFYSLSDDLVHWSKRKLIKEQVLPWTYRCGKPSPVSLPSVIDPRSKSRNFETTGRRAYLYYTRNHYDNCIGNDNRDLVRVPIEFSK